MMRHSCRSNLREHERKRKFTLSCSRCRISKLKCDRKEPCSECIKRDLGHLCEKDERLPRGKRSTVDSTKRSIYKDVRTKNLHDSHQCFTEKAVTELEEYIFDQRDQVNNRQDHDRNNVLPDSHNPYWQTVEFANDIRKGEYFDLIEEITIQLPDSKLIKTLSEVFITRCQAPIGNVIHTSSHMLQIERLCACIDTPLHEERKKLLCRYFTMDMLACLLLSLKLGMAFHPSPDLIGWSPTAQALQVEQIRSEQKKRCEEWGKLAQRCLKGDLVPFTGSIASLQACIMILLDGQEERVTLDNLLSCAISGARRLGLHKLGKAELKPEPGERFASLILPSHIRTEIAIRIWWALSIHDCAHAQRVGQNTIHPFQVSTRRPLHINDDALSMDLIPLDEKGRIPEQPKTEFTMLSYTTYAIEISDLLREILQAKTQEAKTKCGQRYEALVANLPPHFRLGSTMGLKASVGPAQAILIHRWMIHQQLWSLLLRLHRDYLATSNSSEDCRILALNIIGSQKQLQSSCTVCGSLSTNSNQAFLAAAILLFDLLKEECVAKEDKSGNNQFVRLMTRDKVWEAIELLKHSLQSNQEHTNQITERGIELLEALMEFEECEVYTNKANSNSDRMSIEDLKIRMQSIFDSLYKRNNGAEASSSIPCSTVSATELLMDLNVLPITAEDQYSFNSLHQSELIYSLTSSQYNFSEESFELGTFLDMMMASSIFDSSPQFQ